MLTYEERCILLLITFLLLQQGLASVYATIFCTSPNCADCLPKQYIVVFSNQSSIVRESSLCNLDIENNIRESGFIHLDHLV